jgi:hypothetical protein
MMIRGKERKGERKKKMKTEGGDRVADPDPYPDPNGSALI